MLLQQIHLCSVQQIHKNSAYISLNLLRFTRYNNPQQVLKLKKKNCSQYKKNDIKRFTATVYTENKHAKVVIPTKI